MSRHWSEETNWKPLRAAVAGLMRDVERHYHECNADKAGEAHDDLIRAEWRLRQAEKRAGK